MAHLTGDRGNYASKLPSQQHRAKIILEIVFFGASQTESFYLMIVLISHILQLFVIFGCFEFLEEIHIS